MAELDDFEQSQADLIAKRFEDQGMEPERAAEAAKALVLQAASAGMLAGLEGQKP